MTPLILDPAFVYLLAYRFGLVIAGTAILLLIASCKPDSSIARWLRRKRFWLRMAFLLGVLLTLPHFIDPGPPTVYRF